MSSGVTASAPTPGAVLSGPVVEADACLLVQVENAVRRAVWKAAAQSLVRLGAVGTSPADLAHAAALNTGPVRSALRV